MFNLTINSTNVANSLNNMYQYQFKNGAFEVPANAEMMITSFQIPYSWYNITTRYNNNSFKIHWPSSTVNSITLTNGGSGYTSVPTVVFTGTNTTTATATATIAPTSVASSTITAAGSGYTSAPTVAFTGGGGTGAVGTVLLTTTSIGSISVSPKGSGYTSVPIVVFSDGTATGTAVLTGTTIASLTVSAGGQGYTTVPTVVFTGGGGTGATATAVLAYVVPFVNITVPGANYTSAPTVVFTGGGGTGATATATLGTGVDAGKVILISVTNVGSGYTTTPTVSFTGGGGTGATALAVRITRVGSITLTAAGAGYTSVPIISFTGGAGTGTTATANIVATTVASITIGTAGSYTSVPPTISFTDGGGTGAVAIATLTATTVASITFTSNGSNYTSLPSVTFSGGGGGTGAAATAVLTPTSVASLTLTGAGTGYEASPTISFTGGGTATATANAYTPYTLTLDDGFYTVNALNARIQQFCITNNMYLTDGSGNNVYYLSVSPNSTAYANQIITKLIPLAVTGYTAPPAGFAGYPLTTKRPPYVEILSNNFGKYLGFTTGNYGKDQIADYNVLSNIIPTATTVNSLLVKCSLVNNGCSNQSDILDAFAIGGSSGGTFGGNLNYTNNIEKWVRISEGRYNNFIVTIVDQNNNEISILDNNLLINFLIRVK